MTTESTATFDVGKIIAMKTLRAKAHSLMDAVTELSEPTLEDLSLLPQIHSIYASALGLNTAAEIQSVHNRRKLLMVVLYLYSPATLVGERMRVGLRTALSELFGLNSASPVSDNCTGLILHYQKYPDFRRDVNRLYAEVMRYLTIGQGDC